MVTELMHYGVEGMKWGERRFQNEDGSLTPAGKIRYGSSLTNTYDRDNEDDDYKVSKGTSIFRRTDSDRDDDYTDEKYTYTYDYDNERDNKFYKQFGKKVAEYELADDTVLAGKRTLGEAFVKKMLTITDEEDVDALDILYSDVRKRNAGKKYAEDVFTMPFEPSKRMDTLREIGSEMVSRMLATQRNDALDAKMMRRGMRDSGTAANDIGRGIVDKLLSDGYSGIRDYNDYGSSANVTTPTVFFDPTRKLNKIRSWLDD